MELFLFLGRDDGFGRAEVAIARDQEELNVDTTDWADAGDQEQDRGRGTIDLRQVSAPLADQYFIASMEASRD